MTLYERADRIGGLLRYGIPDFKMEKAGIDRRMEQMAAEGVTFVTNAHVGVNVPVLQLPSAPLSTRHWTVDGLPATVNVMVGVVSFDSAAGCVLIVTVGAMVSTVNELVVALVVLVAPSVTRTVIV